jgi:hypothetical protein
MIFVMIGIKLYYFVVEGMSCTNICRQQYDKYMLIIRYIIGTLLKIGKLVLYYTKKWTV